MGNLIALRRAGRPGAPTVMLDAHLDEIGLIVTGHEKGFLRFASLGGVDARMLPALEVTLLAPEGPLPGVIDVLPPHVLSPKDQEKPLAEDKLFIDVGLSQEEAQRRVPPGTPAVFAAPCGMLGEHRLCGKALDDRSCAAIVIQVMEQLRDEPLEVNVAVLLAAQEEVGCRGAVTGAYAVDPEAAIAVDVTHGSTPDAPAHKTFPLNGGAAIGVGPNMTRRISDRLGGPGPGAGDPLFPGGHGWPQRDRRLGHPDKPGRRGHGSGVPSPEAYAHPGGGHGPAGRTGPGPAAVRLGGDLREGGLNHAGYG